MGINVSLIRGEAFRAWADALDVVTIARYGPKSAFFSPLFLGKSGPVWGKGARAFQLGGRDWCLFAQARDLAGKLDEADASALRKLLGDSVQQVLARENDPAAADAVREKLLREMARLQKK